MDGVGPLPWPQLVHVPGITEVRVPVMAHGEGDLGLRGSDLEGLLEATELDGLAVQFHDEQRQLALVFDLSLQANKLHCAFGHL